MSAGAAPVWVQLEPPRSRAAAALRVRGSLRPRAAVLAVLRADDGSMGLGEAMPLPGYSRDDAQAVETALAAIAAGGRWPLPAGRAALLAPGEWLDAALAPHALRLALTPSARFALECALVDLMARRRAEPAACWLAGGRDLQPVPVSLLLPDADAEAPAAAAAAAAAGFAVLKLKIARADRDEREEDRLLAALRAAIDAATPQGLAPARLRLDANGALDPAVVAPRLAGLQRFGVELVEEPVQAAAHLALPPLALPWAADESLADLTHASALLALPLSRRPAAWVLKPSQLGIACCLRLAASAAAQGLGLIVTHGFDGDLGHAAACALAQALPQAPWPCGLAPHDGLHRPGPAAPWLPPPSAPGWGLDAAGFGA